VKVETLVDRRALEIVQTPPEERTWGEIQHALQSETPVSFIEWFGTDVRDAGAGNYTALAIPYADARFFQKRLDEVVGMFRWESEVRFEGGLLMVGIGITPPKTAKVIWKWDTGQEKAEIDDGGGFGGGKGVFTGSFKRACYQWGIGRDLYDLPKPRCRCRAYKGKSGKQQFGGWVDQPSAKMAESGETGKVHASQVDDPTDHIPPNANSFYTIAYTRLKYDRETATAILQNFKDEESGEYNYDGAIKRLETELPADQRAYTAQESKGASNGS